MLLQLKLERYQVKLLQAVVLDAQMLINQNSGIYFMTCKTWVMHRQLLGRAEPNHLALCHACNHGHSMSCVVPMTGMHGRPKNKANLAFSTKL